MFEKDDIVFILTKEHIRGTIGTVVYKLKGKQYKVMLTEHGCSWIEIFTEDELKLKRNQ